MVTMLIDYMRMQCVTSIYYHYNHYRYVHLLHLSMDFEQCCDDRYKMYEQ